jgi:hypothetical protein
MYQGNLSAASNRADWEVACEIVDPETSAPIDLSGATITVMVARPEDTQSAVVTLSTDDGGVVITGLGAFTWRARADAMTALCPGSHPVYVRIVTASGDVTQLIAGDLPVIDGGPR